MIIDKSRKKEEDFTDAEIVESAKDRHMWVSAFALVGTPSDEILRSIGEWVVEQLRDAPMSDNLVGSTPVVYLRVNAS